MYCSSAEYSHAPVSSDSVSMVYSGPPKKRTWKIKEIYGS
jgi:hypothetical protein